MEFSTSVSEIIKKRYSVRTYTGNPIEGEKREQIKQEMQKLSNSKYRFVLIDNKLEEGVKLGTYGMIKGASTFIIGIMDKKEIADKDTVVDFGYTFEGLVLKCTELGLGTCWMMGTFNSKHALKLAALNETEQIIMVSPLGYGDKMSGKDKFVRFLSKADKRKPWEEIFFNQSFNTPLSRAAAGEYADVLDMLRLAPSAINKQPWRILKTDKGFDIYTVMAATSEKEEERFNSSYNDIGIAKAHFEYTAREKGLKGNWVRNDNYTKQEGLMYICSWQEGIE